MATPPPPRTATPPPPKAHNAAPISDVTATGTEIEVPREEPAVTPETGAVSEIIEAPIQTAVSNGLGFKRATAKSSGSRIILTAVEGWGKTSTAAYADKPEDVAMIFSQNETGYDELLKKNLVPQVDCIQFNEWNPYMELLRNLAKGDKRFYRIIALDALVGFERLCHEFVCARDYRGDWGNKGFCNFMQGYAVAVNDWLQMLSLLDQIRAKGTHILMLGHIFIKSFKNPTGPDYDRYTSDLHEKTWSQTFKWADAVLFGNFITVIDQKNGGKAIAGTERVIYTQRCDAWDAKNRYGIPERIDISNKPQETWAKIAQHLPSID